MKLVGKAGIGIFCERDNPPRLLWQGALDYDGSDPQNFEGMNGLIYFLANSRRRSPGRELWGA